MGEGGLSWVLMRQGATGFSREEGGVVAGRGDSSGRGSSSSGRSRGSSSRGSNDRGGGAVAAGMGAVAVGGGQWL